MKDLSGLWDSLRSDAQDRSAGLVLRKLKSVGLRIGIDISRNKRVLLLELFLGEKIDIRELPCWKSVALSIFDMGGGKNSLLLRLIDDDSVDIFDALIRDLDDSLTDAMTLKEAFNLFIDRLGVWRNFFERHGYNILGPEAQQGLFGELYLLQEHVLTHAEHVQALHFWRGHDRKYQDFSFPHGNVEVKTTARKEHKTVIINSEKQLDETGLESLGLYCLAVNISENSGITLPGIIGEIRDLLAGVPGAVTLFNRYLHHVGYIDEHEEHYVGMGYLTVEEYFFEVCEGFPRITNPPPGVGDVKYSIVLSACKDYRADIEPVIAKMIGGTI